MKTLCLFRHAKSTWGALGTDDIERPLHPIGEINATMMGEFIKEKGIKPDLILTSNALRATATADLLASALDYSQEKIMSEEKLYDANVEELTQVIEGMDNKFKSIILVGHNPGLTLIANYLADDHINNLPTCGIFCLELDTNDWAELTTANSKLLFIDEPRKHRGK